MRRLASSLTISVPPAFEPVPREEMKTHLRVDHNAEDGYIDSINRAAREWVETLCGLALLTQTLIHTQARFPTAADLPEWAINEGRGASLDIRLTRAPVQSITSVQYLDDDDVAQTVSAATYRLAAERPARIVPKVGATWPQVSPRPAAVIITYVAGYSSAEVVPEPIKQAIKLMAGHLYENREASISGTIITQLPRGIMDLLAPHRVSYV